MCFDAMEVNSKRIKLGGERKNIDSGSKMTLSLLLEDEDEALSNGRRSAIKMIIRKHPRLEKRRARLARHPRNHGNLIKNVTGKSRPQNGPVEHCVLRQPSGAMAPNNTTQYLMGNVYEDMRMSDDVDDQPDPVTRQTSIHQYGQSPSPNDVYSALDTGYESVLSYQQKDFEEAFRLYLEPCWVGVLGPVTQPGIRIQNPPPLSISENPEVWLLCT